MRSLACALGVVTLPAACKTGSDERSAPAASLALTEAILDAVADD